MFATIATNTLLLADIGTPEIAVGGGILVALVAIIVGTRQSVLRTKAVEESRREIAAYVAEGSISPDDAERLLKARANDDD